MQRTNFTSILNIAMKAGYGTSKYYQIITQIEFKQIYCSLPVHSLFKNVQK